MIKRIAKVWPGLLLSASLLLNVAWLSPHAFADTAAVTETNAPSINPSAAKGKSSQDSGAMLNMVMAGAMFAACLASQPPNMALCAMGALAAAQAGADKGASDQSGATFNASSYDPATGQSPTTTPVAASAQGDAKYTAQAAQGMAALKAAGYKVSDKGVINPDGSLTPASAFDSPSSMASAGISAGTIQEAQKIIAAVNEDAAKMKVSSVGVNEGTSGAGGVGGTGGDGSGGSESSNRAFAGFGNPFKLNAGQKKQLNSGKTVLFDGEPIGVKGQNIFDMVHVAYERKQQGNHFLENAGADVSVRAPASVTSKKTK